MKRYWFLILVLFACEKKQTKEDEMISATFEAERQAFFDQMLNPDAAAAVIQETQLAFNPALINNPTYFSSYTTSEVKASTNLGVYLADLNYSLAYHQKQSAQELFQAAHELSKVVGVEQRMLGFLMVRYEKNLEQNDSAKAIVTELFEGATSGLRGTDREKFVGLVIAGYQIENLHLGLGILQSNANLSEADNKNLTPIRRLILDQQQPLTTTFQFLMTIADPTNPNKNPNLAYYSTAYRELLAVYGKMSPVSSSEGSEDEVLNPVIRDELTEKVSTIRTKIIGL